MSITLDADLGRVSVAGDKLQVTFRRRYARPIEKVWAAVTTPERLADWLAKAEYEAKVGGAVRITWSAADYSMDGKVVAYDPPRRFAWTWPLDGRDTVVSFDLEADGDGCWLTLTHAGLDPKGKDGNGVRAGWHAHLDGIADAIDGRATSWATVMAREKAISPSYPKLSD
jgi:uncharacterized protein YndB with AHSA1/START domain